MNDDLQLDMRSHIETLQPRPTVVMLGASNLSRSFPIAISMAQQILNSPLTIHVAKGHGRSYGQESSCFGKKNSGIFSCGIWRTIEQEKKSPITAFMTDIGNDLAYEVPVQRVYEWVEACLDRLLNQNARIVMSDLPIEVLRQLSETRYRIFRQLLFPQCRLDWCEMLYLAEQLSERLCELAKNREVPFFAVRKEWYGFDPIHPRKFFYRRFWSEIWTTLGEATEALPTSRCSFAKAWYLRSLRCESWSTFGFSRRASQPNGRLRDGTTIALY